MMKALTHNIQQEREDQRDRSAQLFMLSLIHISEPTRPY